MTLQQNSLEIPITKEALATAERFAAQQPHAQQQEQIRLNTLAVWAVHDYLKLMNIETEPDRSDSWNPVLRLCEDVADLMVKKRGKLECRPLLPDAVKARVCLLPPEVCCDRIGYMVVKIDSSQKKATLLGFTPTVKDERLVLNELQPVTDLLQHLEFLGQRLLRRETTDTCGEQNRLCALTNGQPQVQLDRWLDNIIPTAWQEIETIFAIEPESPTDSKSDERSSNLPGWLENIVDSSREIWSDLSGTENNELSTEGAFRSPTNVRSLLPECKLMRAKLIDLGVQLGSQTVVLLLALTPESDRKLRLVVQMYPQVGDNYLPANLKLALLAGSGEKLQSVTARTQDRGIQLTPFKILRDTNFQLQITLDDLSLTETFSF